MCSRKVVWFIWFRYYLKIYRFKQYQFQNLNITRVSRKKWVLHHALNPFIVCNFNSLSTSNPKCSIRYYNFLNVSCYAPNSKVSTGTSLKGIMSSFLMLTLILIIFMEENRAILNNVNVFNFMRLKFHDLVCWFLFR